jgi:SnoaL-like domain
MDKNSGVTPLAARLGVVAFLLISGVGKLPTWSAPAAFAASKGAPERRQAMSSGASTLATRNLYEVFGENDPARRRAAIDEIFTDDSVFYDPMGGVYRGRAEIDRVAGAVRAAHPDFRYQLIAKPEEVGNAARVQWVEGRPGEAPATAGTDVIIAKDGRIAFIYLFFDKGP